MKYSSTVTRLALLALFSAGTISCSQIDAPTPSNDNDTSQNIDDQDTSQDIEDINETEDAQNQDQDTTPPNACNSNTPCNERTQFCDTTNQCQNFPQLALAGQHTCAILHDGSVRCWGDNSLGQLGIGKTSDSPELTPQKVELENPARLISAGTTNTCVVSIDDQILCWGHLDPDSHNLSRFTSPAPITHEHTSPEDPIAQIVTGSVHSCVLHNSGRVFCWGSNTSGQLGRNKSTTPPPTTKALEVTLDPGNTFIATAPNRTCIVNKNNEIYCWGSNTDGVLGTLDESGVHLSEHLFIPTKIPGISDVTSITMGESHICALDHDERVKCWGSNEFGQLGEPQTVTTQQTPPQVSPSE